MSYTCPRRDCDGFATDDPQEMRAHTAAHGPATVDPRLPERVRLFALWAVAMVALWPVALVVAVIVMIHLGLFDGDS